MASSQIGAIPGDKQIESVIERSLAAVQSLPSHADYPNDRDVSIAVV